LYHKGAGGLERYHGGSMNSRVTVLVLGLLALLGCGGTREAQLEPLPLNAGPWTRTAYEAHQGTAGLGEGFETAAQLSARAWGRGKYTREGVEVTVTSFLFPSEANAFEAQQKWPRGLKEMAFYQGAHFAVCSSTVLPIPDMLEFAAALEIAWLPRDKR
jgi:hypothetical protein